MKEDLMNFNNNQINIKIKYIIKIKKLKDQMMKKIELKEVL